MRSSIDAVIEGKLKEFSIPGSAVGIVRDGKLVWAKGYGWADVTRKVPMTPKTIMNIGSISKTITATAVMQLWERELIDLDTDVSRYLPYQVLNPKYPSMPITARRLLNHRSSIRDGKCYWETYACGDPAAALGDWLEAYLAPGGAYYDAKDNFHGWAPGILQPDQTNGYCNVAYGLLGHLVERLTGTHFTDYCAAHIFTPLGMSSTGWYLRDINVDRHAVLYGRITKEKLEKGRQSFSSLLPAPGLTIDELKLGGRMPHCLYGYPTYPEGLARTSVEELSLFLATYGDRGRNQLLKQATIDLMVSEVHDGRALCWHKLVLANGDIIWGHPGSDPGVKTHIGFREKDGTGAIVLFNGDDIGDSKEVIVETLFCDAASP
ncbi:MAG: class A beta-lactamase-related serine hydrolase [Mesorhizobium sp.]|uniref:serine hydrolase domain-containing protein n=1 Tax=unclassified Mesorhizobium TaxID=325217 RepID=UPI000F74C877|nr:MULTISPECIES: serine hydrolase domain-containing protein [unclassified Mesorhizobium]AZO59503.1 class A beta-lactamase-related serine hydrolase [Mesorhizobium sp. M1A.F.Ca.IN.022.06.1.1]RWG44380.1 MAG: class A beta-lactamase-related serine hydrolase [Mesorhizobium sp.]